MSARRRTEAVTRATRLGLIFLCAIPLVDTAAPGAPVPPPKPAQRAYIEDDEALNQLPEALARLVEMASPSVVRVEARQLFLTTSITSIVWQPEWSEATLPDRRIINRRPTGRHKP